MKRISIVFFIVVSILLLSGCVSKAESETSQSTLDIIIQPEKATQPEEELKVEAEDEVITSSEGSRPARNPMTGALQGYGDDRISEIQYDTRYGFEQIELPGRVFEYENEVIELIESSDISSFEEFVQVAFLYSALTMIIDDFDAQEEEYALQGDEQRQELLLRKSFEYDLIVTSHIIEVTIETIDGNTNAAIIELYDTGWRPLSTFIGIAYNDTSGLSYFTLERSYGGKEDGSDDHYMFCWVEVGSRGSIYRIDNSKEAFIEAISDIT